MTQLLHRSTRRPLTRILLIMMATQMAGCMAYSRRGFDLDRTPVFNMGTRATIIYPGQAAPVLPSSAPPAYTQPGQPGQAGVTTQRVVPLPPGTAPQGPAQTQALSREGAPQVAGTHPAPQPAPRPLSSDEEDFDALDIQQRGGRDGLIAWSGNLESYEHWRGG